MMERVLARGRAIAARRLKEMSALIEQAARDELPELGVEREGDGVTVSGRRLRWRMVRDGRLRSIGLGLRGRIG